MIKDWNRLFEMSYSRQNIVVIFLYSKNMIENRWEYFGLTVCKFIKRVEGSQIKCPKKKKQCKFNQEKKALL